MRYNFQTHLNQIEFFQVNNIQIAYDVVVGPSEEEAKTQILFLINGFQRTRQDFRALRQKVTREAGSIISVAFDNRFCGQTTTISNENFSESITLVDFAKDALALLKHCMETFQVNRVHVLGISMGGMIAQILASLPDCPPLETLFLVSTTAGGTNRIWPEQAHLRKDAPITSANPPHSEERLGLYFGEKFLKKLTSFV